MYHGLRAVAVMPGGGLLLDVPVGFEFRKVLADNQNVILHK
jgi:hypothetical protein